MHRDVLIEANDIVAKYQICDIWHMKIRSNYSERVMCPQVCQVFTSELVINAAPGSLIWSWKKISDKFGEIVDHILETEYVDVWIK